MLLNYNSKGDGPLQIIFVHGNSQSSKVWDKLFNVDVLKPYKLIAIDLPGHGKSFRSTAPDEDYSLIGMGNHLLNCLKEFENQPYILVGNSLATNIIGEIALKLNNCKGILFTGSCAVGKGLGLGDIFLPNPSGGLGFMEELTEEQLTELVNSLGSNLTLEDIILIKQEFKLTDPKLRLQLAMEFTGAHFSDELKNLEDSKIPLAIVFGEEEKICNIDCFDKIELVKWRDKVTLIKNSAHFPHLDQAKKLADVINDFAKDSFN